MEHESRVLYFGKYGNQESVKGLVLHVSCANMTNTQTTRRVVLTLPSMTQR